MPSLLRLYRFPYERFGIFAALGFSFLLGIGIQEIGIFLARNSRSATSLFNSLLRRIPLILIFFALFGLLAAPFWTGSVIYSGGNITPSARIEVPNYYNSAASWIAQDKTDFNVLSLPLGVLRYSVLQWDNGTHGYFAENPDMWLFNKPTIFYSTQGDGMAGLFANTLISNYDFRLGSLDGWTSTVFSSNFTTTIQKQNDSYAADVSLSKNARGFLDRQSMFDVQGKPIDMEINLEAKKGNAGANAAVLFYNQTKYLGSIESDSINMGKSRPIITNMTEVSEISINKWWFASIDATKDFDSWYFHTSAFTQPIKVIISFQGSGYVDVNSNNHVIIPRTFVENSSFSLQILILTLIAGLNPEFINRKTISPIYRFNLSNLF